MKQKRLSSAFCKFYQRGGCHVGAGTLALGASWLLATKGIVPSAYDVYPLGGAAVLCIIDGVSDLASSVTPKQRALRHSF